MSQFAAVLGFDKALAKQRAHEVKLAGISAQGKARTPGANFLKGLKARIKAGGPQGSAAYRNQLSLNPPPTSLRKKKHDDEGRG